MSSPTLSVIIIADNEAHRLRPCLQSVSWADEVIVVDSQSTDGTVALAREFTDKVFVEAWRGFGPQKNFALSKATKDWVLSIDADERVTPELERSIRDAMRNAEHAGYEVKRRNMYCGKIVRHGDWGRDRVLRLFKREAGRFQNLQLHEGVELDGSVGELQGAMLHDSIQTREQMLAKIESYSTIWAKQAHAMGRRCGPLTKYVRASFAFVRSAVIFGGILDGRTGIALAMHEAHGAFERYRKLRGLARTGGRGG
jgi:glycosyltransferase involved in cell wall biosynthesis